jgi:predicted deacetylase
MLMATQSIHDCKIITNGEEKKHISWYISSYVAKQQQHSSNASVLLANTFAYHRDNKRQSIDLYQVNMCLIQRCANALS